jgi:propionyl-CoA carboxylase beta chain
MAMKDQFDLLATKAQQALKGGGDDRIEAQHKKGKLTARERLHLLLDEGSFQEIGQLVAHRSTNFGLDKQVFLGDGVITGHGTINGRTVYVFSQDFTVLGGSLAEAHAAKICRIMDLAMRNGGPVIGLNDSGGARIQEGVVSLGGYADIFHRNVMASGVVPQISAIMGPCAGGAVYSPALTDMVLMVEGTSYMFVTGPNVVKTVTHEEVTSEELGGASTHAAKSGVAHFTAANELAALDMLRKLVGFMPNNCEEKAPAFVYEPGDESRPTLDSILPENPNQPYDIREVMNAVIDPDSSMEVHAEYARNMVVALPAWPVKWWAAWPTSPRYSPVCWTSMPPSRPRASCGSAMHSTYRCSSSWTCPASCPAPTRSGAASLTMARSCSTPSAKPPCRASP